LRFSSLEVFCFVGFVFNILLFVILGDLMHRVLGKVNYTDGITL
jgi:hypothetical protein